MTPSCKANHLSPRRGNLRHKIELVRFSQLNLARSPHQSIRPQTHTFDHRQS
jgi:hypothetical protein